MSHRHCSTAAMKPTSILAFQGGTPYKNTGRWFSLGNDDGWQTSTWQVKDACFAKMWGHDISFRPEQSQPFVIGKVEVSTEPF